MRKYQVGEDEPKHDKTNKMICAPSENSDQPGHPPSLIRVIAVRVKTPSVLNYMYPLSAKRKLSSDWADAQADLSLRLAHRIFVDFLMMQRRYETGHKKRWGNNAR